MIRSIETSTAGRTFNLRQTIAAILALGSVAGALTTVDAVAQDATQTTASGSASDASASTDTKDKKDQKDQADVANLSDVNVSADSLRALSNEPSASSFGFSKPLLETPRTVSFVSEEQLRLFGVSSVEDLTRLVPGTYTTTRYGLQGAINVRGVTADTYYRGMKRLDQQGHVRTILSAYDNIEVVKGPPSPLYGMGRIGGYTNLDPKSSRAKTGKYMTDSQGYVEGTYGSYKKSELQFGAGVPFTVADRAAGVYVVALLEDTESTFVKNVGAQQRFLQATTSVDNAVGPFRLEMGGQLQNSITSGSYMNRTTQALIDHGDYVRGQPMVNLDLNGDGRIGYVETYLGSPVAGKITGSNQALTQRYSWPVDANGNPIPVSQFKNSIAGIPANFQQYLIAHPEISCQAADVMRAATPVTFSATSGTLISRQIPQGFFLNPCTVSVQPVDYRGNGSFERQQNAQQRMGYFDLIYDTDPNFTVKNQFFYDSIDSFKDSWLPYGERQYIKAYEDKITITKRLPSEWLPGWLSVNALGSVNYRDTRGYIRSSGGDFDHRQDILYTTGSGGWEGSGTGGMYPNTMFWTQLTNDSYATGAQKTREVFSQTDESGAGLMFDMDIFTKTNLLVGGRYDWVKAKATNGDIFNPTTGTVNVTPQLIQDYIAGIACQMAGPNCPGGYTPGSGVDGNDSGKSWSASLSHQLPFGLRPYVTIANSTLTLDGSNNLWTTSTVGGGKLVGDAELKEAGIKGVAFSGKMQWSFDVFKQTRTDVSSPSDPSVNVEVTSTETKGGEAEIKLAPTRKLFISGSVTYLQSNYIVGANGTNIDVDGRTLGFQDVKDPNGKVLYPAEAFMYGGWTSLQLTDPNNIYHEVPGLPHWQAAINATYQLPKGFGLLADAQYFSDSWADRIQSEVIPAATVYNAGITWDRNKVHLRLSGYNLTDKIYFRSGRNALLVSVMPTRRWEAQVKINF